MKIIFTLALMLGFAPACMATQSTWKRIGPEITASLNVDAQGHVTHAQLVGENILPQLQALVEQTTRSWKFMPATLDGKSVPSRTYASLAVEMHKADGKTQLRLHYDRHGPGRVFMENIAYPTEMMRQRIEAFVVVAFNVNGDGSVSNIHVVTAKTSHGAKGAAFYKELITAIQKDRYLPELVDGRPVITHMRRPVRFTINGLNETERLVSATDAPHRSNSDDKPDVTTFADIPVALDSPLKLLTAQP